jgi:hypothetical protein
VVASQALTHTLDDLPIGVLTDDVARSQRLKSCKISHLGCARLHDDTWHLLTSFVQCLQHIRTFPIWQMFVDQHQIENMQIHKSQHVPGGPHRCGVKSGIFQKPLQNDKDVAVTVRYQNLSFVVLS